MVVIISMTLFIIPVAADAPSTTFTVREAIACTACSLCLGLDGQTITPCESYIVPIWVTNNGQNEHGRFLTGGTFEVTIDTSKLEWFFPRESAAYDNEDETNAERRRAFPFMFELPGDIESLLGVPTVLPHVGQFSGNTVTFNLVNPNSSRRAEAFILAIRVKPLGSFNLTNDFAPITLEVTSPVGRVASEPSGPMGNVIIVSGGIGFGVVPPTGFPDMSMYITALFSILILSAVLWGFVLRRKLSSRNA
jgi:hypothetical protein